LRLRSITGKDGGGWQSLSAHRCERLEADSAKSPARLIDARRPQARPIATKRRIARKTREFVTLPAAERSGVQLPYRADEVRRVPAREGVAFPASPPPPRCNANLVRHDPLAFGFSNSGSVFHLLAVLVAMFSIGAFAREPSP
jgi:hypothetical protein